MCMSWCRGEGSLCITFECGSLFDEGDDSTFRSSHQAMQDEYKTPMPILVLRAVCEF